MSKPTVFISYNWESGDSIADELESRLNPYADVKRDKKSLKAWDNLTKFMKSIREQDFAVLIITDEYLTSEGCMFEVTELMGEEQWDGRVMYVVADNIHGIYETLHHFKYIDFWAKTAKQLEKEINNRDSDGVKAQREDLRRAKLISQRVGEFLAKIKDTNNPAGVDRAIEEVVKRVKEKSQAFLEKNEETDAFEKGIAQIEIPNTIREGWNFHNDIALRLELKARGMFGGESRPYTKIYDADDIEGGQFAETMIAVLRQKTGYESNREDVREFVKICSRYIGKNGYEIEPKISQGLLNRFMELMKDKSV